METQRQQDKRRAADMYGINGKRIAEDGVQEFLAGGADTWTEAQGKATRARELGWQQVRVVPATANTCHSPLGDGPDSPVCALGARHAEQWHETSDQLLQWRDDDPAMLRLALAEQRERDARCVTGA